MENSASSGDEVDGGDLVGVAERGQGHFEMGDFLRLKCTTLAEGGGERFEEGVSVEFAIGLDAESWR